MSNAAPLIPLGAAAVCAPSFEKRWHVPAVGAAQKRALQNGDAKPGAAKKVKKPEPAAAPARKNPPKVQPMLSPWALGLKIRII